ncbi:MAG: M56 family metallopeptidase, partial [Myxococcales bacterium]|nr:M56 family metallopeptidase [Myxococcales bacterium]
PLRGRIHVVEGPGPVAATRGFFKPRIEIARELVGRVDDDELRAVLLHEAAHLQGRDPTWLILSAISIGLNPFGRWLRPALGQWRFARELQCDRSAVTLGAEPLALASAIVTAAGRHMVQGPCRAGVADGSPAEIRSRIAFLFSYAGCPPQRSPGKELSFGILVSIAALIIAAPHFLDSTLSVHCTLESALQSAFTRS